MSCLTEKTIGELLEYKFFIPSYQRGFRWTERQVEDLLEDINAFTPTPIEKTGKKTWYCLQPVVVKECSEITKKENKLQGRWYEVIDGQQRLTSIFLLIHYANEMWVGKQKISEFEIKYETRNESFEFLQKQKIDEISDKAIINYDNIDFHHITKAYNKIHNWVKNFKKKFEKDFDNNDFQSKLKSNSKVIWYEVSSEKDAIEIFTRINMGKIPLTNAELIKALFLNSSNFPDSDTEEIRLRQLEIASEWDRMEYSLQNNELWYFINNSENELPTRIEYLFNIMKNIDGIKNGNDQYSTFRFFSEKFKSKSKDEIDTNWKEIKRIYQTIEEWFTDRELYHKIGFLISADSEITELLKEVRNKQKQEFRKLLDIKIAEKVKCENLKELEYGKHSNLIRKILLQHNIQTMLNNNDETIRFPFVRYKDKKIGWDLEHIHAIATEVKVKQDEQKIWLENNFVEDKEHQDKVSNDKILDIKNGNTIDEKDFQSIIEYVLGDEDNSIRNLCLLDRGTNRSYKNDSFKNKRKKIIETEKKGTFIPVCTRNVFMKYYTKELKDLEIWDINNDRTDYFEDLKSVVYNAKS